MTNNTNTATIHPDTSGRIYNVTADGVTIDMLGNWNTAFTLMQELGKRLGFHRVRVLSIKDTRTAAQRGGGK